MTNLEQALQYHKLGFSVFPLWRGSKDKPLTQWKKCITVKSTEKEIKDWWTKWPDANIAIVTGLISGIAVLDTEKDFDLKNIQIEEGTPTAKTGSGGRHFYYRIPNEVQTHIEIWGSNPKNKADIKAYGGYVVAPPSVNEKTGGQYEWIVPIREKIPPVPQWLQDEIDRLREATSTEKFHVGEIVEGVGEGNRNSTAASFIGHILTQAQPTIWETVCWPAVVVWNRKNNPPLDETELRGTFKSIMNREFMRRQGVVVKRETKDWRDYHEADEVVSAEELKKTFETDDGRIKYYCKKLPTYDSLTDGVVPGEVILISGPRKNGKTSLLQTFTMSYAEQGLPCLWFTYEMTPRELIAKFPRLPVFYLPRENVSNNTDWLEDRINEAKEKFGIKIVFIDHLMFLYDKMIEKNSSLNIGATVRRVKNIAREKDLVVYLAHHIKNVEWGTDPGDNDLRDSSLIAGEVDSTTMIWRVPEGGFAKKKINEEIVWGNQAKIKVCNHRRTGVFQRSFMVKYLDNEFHEISGPQSGGGSITVADIEF